MVTPLCARVEKTPRRKTPLTCAIDAAKREGLVPAQVNESSAGRRPSREAGSSLTSRSPRVTFLLTTMLRGHRRVLGVHRAHGHHCHHSCATDRPLHRTAGTRLSPRLTSTRRTLTFRARCRRDPARRIAGIMIDHPCWGNCIVACHSSLRMTTNARTCRLRQSIVSHVAPRFVRTRQSADPGARDSARVDARMHPGAGSDRARSHSARDRCACAAWA